MVCLPEDLSFPAWVSHVFDHPYQPRPWYWEFDADCWPVSIAVAAPYVDRFFRDAGELLAPYTDAQAGQGLNYLSSPSFAEYGHTAVSETVPLELRLAIVAGIGELFRQVYAPRCGDRIAHPDDEPSEPLLSSCFMWWDAFPWYPKGGSPERDAIDARMMRVLEEVLALPSAACQEAALHGLGHATGGTPESPAGQIIERFLADDAARRPELVSYARAARRDRIL